MLPQTHRTFELRQRLLVDALVLTLVQIRVVGVRLLLRLLVRRTVMGVIAAATSSVVRRLVAVMIGTSIAAAVVVFLRLPRRSGRVPFAFHRRSTPAAGAALVDSLVGIKSQTILVVRLR